MADPPALQNIFTDKRLNITRETELLQSFVRVNVDDETTESADESKTEPSATGTAANVSKQDSKDGGGSTVAGIHAETTKKKVSFQDDNATPAQELTEEVKKKVKRRRRRNGSSRREELYCDKDRAAAVNLGSKDIKQSLKLKRKQDRSKALQIPEEAEPGTFLALGSYEVNRGDLHIGLNFISKALELNPTEKSALVARSKCYILLGQPENALKDAETALNIDKHFMKAIYQKAEALYHLGDFEHSLMYYHRGLHLRPDNEMFKLGVHKAQQAIENAIGPKFSFRKYLNVGPKNENVKPVSSERRRGSDENSTILVTERNRAVSTTPKGSQKSLLSTSRPKTSKKSRLLRELAPDKEYLDNLMKNPNIKCKYKEEGNSQIMECIEQTIQYLDARQEFWRQQLPSHLK